MKLNKPLWFILSASLLMMTQTAHADFRKALEALQNRDGTSMLAEVKDAVDKRNDDGLILYLSILKQYPKTWRPTLPKAKQEELFALLETITNQSSLQSQYKLAVIPRTHGQPKPDSLEAIEEQDALIGRVEPIASKGYTPAAMSLYSAYAFPVNQSRKDEERAMSWLTKAAELGSTQGAFVLGMKYLNIADNTYGCNNWKPSTLICPSKDEVKGWHWMQQAAMKVNERNIMLGDFAYEMGNLYRQGVAGNKPDYEQAYLWYLIAANYAYGYSRSISNVQQNLTEMKQAKQLKRVAPELDENWEDIPKRQAVLNSKYFAKKPYLYQRASAGSKQEKPVFSYYSFGMGAGGRLLDVYANGDVRLAYGYPEDLENNEVLWKVNPSELDNFLNEIDKLGFYEWPFNSDTVSCQNGCSDKTFYIFTVNINSKHSESSRLLTIQTLAGESVFHPWNRRQVQVISLIEKYFPVERYMCDFSSGKDKNNCTELNRKITNSANQGATK